MTLIASFIVKLCFKILSLGFSIFFKQKYFKNSKIISIINNNFSVL